MNFLQLLIAALATWQVVEIVHHGSIFAKQRAKWELMDTFASQLLLCPFCLSVWVGVLLAAVMFGERCVFDDSKFAGHTWYGVAFLGTLRILWLFAVTFVYGLAVSRLANVANDYLYDYTKTPGSGESGIPVDEPPDPENEEPCQKSP